MKENRMAKITAVAVVLIMISASFFACIDIPSADGQGSSDQNSSVPSKYNLDVDKSYGTIFPVRDQGSIGTCWAFSTSATIECALYMQDKSYSGRISPLAIASTMYDNLYHMNQVPAKTEGEDVIYCLGHESTKIDVGGNSTTAMLTMASGKTVILPENCMSYDLASLDLQYTDAELSDVTSLYTVKKVEIYDLLRDADKIKSNLLSGYVGTVAYKSTSNKVYVPVTMESADFITYYEDSLHDSNHMVTLIGWDDNYSKNNFNEKERPNNNGAWITRNSWGTDSEFNGYTYFSYETRTADVMFIKDVELTVSDKGVINTYCYDFGCSESSDIVMNGKASMANIFKSSSGANTEKIEGVSFVTSAGSLTAVGETYTVSVYELNKNHSSPTDGKLLVSKNGKVTAGGLEYVSFDSPIALSKGTEFSVVVDLYNPDGSIIIPVDTDCRASDFVSYTTANPGESWTYINGQWNDISSDHTSNVRIKAYTRTQAEGDGPVLSLDSDQQKYTRYESITKALDAKANNMYLLSNITLTDTVTIGGDKDVRISLNGFNVTYSGVESAFVSNISSSGTEYSTLTITSGKITSSSDAIEGKNVRILFSEIAAGDDEQAVSTTESLDLIYSKVSKGDVTFTPSANAVDSTMIASIAGTLTVGPTNDAVLHIEGGVYADSVFDSGAAAVIKFGDFKNNIDYNNAPEVNVLYGNNLGTDGTVIQQMIDNRDGEECYCICDSKTGAYSFIVPDIAYDGAKYCYKVVDALMDATDGTIEIFSFDDVIHNINLTAKDDKITLGGDKILDLKGQTIQSSATIVIPDGMTLTVYNGTLICNNTTFDVEAGGTLIIGKEGYSTDLILSVNPDVSTGGYVYTVGNNNRMTWTYTDHLENTYKLTSNSITADKTKKTVTFTGNGTVLDKNNKTIAECTGFTLVIGDVNTSTYVGHAEIAEFNFKGYVFDKMTSSYTQPEDDVIYCETVDGCSYSRFVNDYSKSKSDYKMKAYLSFDGSVNTIDIRVIGLKTSTTINGDYLTNAEQVVTKVKEYIYNDKPVKTNISLYVSEEVYKNVNIPYKTFTKNDIAKCVSNKYSISLNVSGVVITADPATLGSGDFSVLFSRNNNGLMNSDQLAAAGDVKGYYIGCSNKELSNVSFTVSTAVNNSYKNPSIYMIDTNGKANEMSTVCSGGVVTFKTAGTGTYLVTEKGNFVTAEKAPAAKTGLVHSGSELALIEPATGVSHGVAEYSLDGKTWSKDVPSAKDVGKYTVYYRYVTTDSSYIGTSATGINVEIQAESGGSSDNTVAIAIGIIVAVCMVAFAVMMIRKR